MTLDLDDIIKRFHQAGVEFIVVGGVAANLHGSARVTLDLDVMYRRSDENILRLVRALKPLSPYLRGAPPGLPFAFDARTVKAGLNFTLDTAAGPLDLLGEMAGVGRYEDAAKHSTPMAITNHDSLVIDLDWLIRAKRAAGRPKDLEAIAELEILRDLQGDPTD
ncbi:MAG: hypothetical protein FJ202_11615 [Gemmatimonadetes bacterium]|nr:hypothetical protein [Gemmatimonadota bacterium]